MTGHPLVSIITPTYNREHLLKETVDSALGQTYKNVEVIIIDDGSVDNTKDLVESMNDQRIRYFYQDNQGASAARNRGIMESKGDFITFLDSDDFFYPEKLEKQIEAFSKLSDDYGVVYCKAKNVTIADQKVVHVGYDQYEKSGDVAEDLLLKPRFATGSLLVKRECFQKVGIFNTSLKIMEDTELWFRVALQYKYYYLSNILCEYRIRVYDNHLSKVPFKTLIKCYRKFLYTAFKHPEFPTRLKRKKHKIYSINALNLAFYGRDEKEFLLSKDLLHKAYRYYPLILLNPRYIKLYYTLCIVGNKAV